MGQFSPVIIFKIFFTELQKSCFIMAHGHLMLMQQKGYVNFSYLRENMRSFLRFHSLCWVLDNHGKKKRIFNEVYQMIF